MGGSPTTAKASLPTIKPATMDTIAGMVKETAKSMTSEESRQTLDAEKELMRTKEDAIIENTEIISYKMLIEMADKAGQRKRPPSSSRACRKRLQWPTLSPATHRCCSR